MSCPLCANTTVKVERVSNTVAAGKISRARATVSASVTAYIESRGTELVQGKIPYHRKLALIVLGSSDVDGADILTDLGDSTQYEIDSLQVFSDHAEAFVRELRADK